MIRHAAQAARTSLAAFAHDTRGTVAVIWGLASIMMIGVVGAGIDYSRAVNTKEILAQELDGAVLAGARFLASSTDKSATKAHITAVFNETSNQAIGARASYAMGPIVIDDKTGKITATATGDVNTAFMQILGFSSMPISVQSQVNYSDKFLEIALVLDVTGSMDQDDGTGQSKIEALRIAATALINTLMPDTGVENDRVRIAIVPYSQGVRLSSSFAKTATNDYSTKCATERTGTQAYTDASYEVEPIGNGSGIEKSKADKAGKGEGDCPKDQLMALTSDRKELLKAIKDLKTGGATAGHTGIAWGWYTLSPNWNGMWPTESEPVANDDKHTLKYIIIMSDGEFNRYYDKTDVTKNTGNALCQLFPWLSFCKNANETTSYWYEVEDKSGAIPSARALSLCTAMKNSAANQGKGISVYTVFLSPDSGTTAETTLKTCASGTDKFTKATDGQALTAAFIRYAQEIQQLYLAK